MATSGNGITIPGTDPATTPATPVQNWFNNIAWSIGGRIPRAIANVAARATYLAALAAEGYTPAASKPVMAWRADAAPGAELEVTTDGSTWRPVGMTGGIKSGSTDANGVISVAHGLGYAPTMMGATVLAAHGTGSELIARYATPMVWLSAADAIQFRFVRRDTNEWFVSQPIAFSWWAR